MSKVLRSTSKIYILRYLYPNVRYNIVKTYLAKIKAIITLQ